MPPPKEAAAHAQKREADGRHHHSRHDRRDDAPPILREQAENPLQHAAYDDGAYERPVSLGGRHRASNRDEGEADAHDDGQAAAHAPERIQLDERADAGDEHGVLNEHRPHILDSPRRHDNGDGGQIRHEHGEHVLKPEGKRLQKPDASVEVRAKPRPSCRGRPRRRALSIASAPFPDAPEAADVQTTARASRGAASRGAPCFCGPIIGGTR